MLGFSKCDGSIILTQPFFSCILCTRDIDTITCFRLDNSGGLLLSDDEDDENYVELEKSNVLLIGPTGSGRISRSLSLSFSMHMHIIMFIF